jgi:hypothetical protein
MTINKTPIKRQNSSNKFGDTVSTVGSTTATQEEAPLRSAWDFLDLLVANWLSGCKTRAHKNQTEQKSNHNFQSFSTLPPFQLYTEAITMNYLFLDRFFLLGQNQLNMARR